MTLTPFRGRRLPLAPSAWVLAVVLASSAAGQLQAAPSQPKAVQPNVAQAALDRQALEGRGAALFKVCRSCHTIEKDGEGATGPNLWGVYGAKSATGEDFPYSAALKASGVVWTPDTLSKWLTAPSKFIPGSKMAYPGMPQEADRQAMIAYMMSRTDKAVPRPAGR